MMKAAGYRIRRTGEVFAFNTPCPEKRGFCFAIWHDDPANDSAPVQASTFKSSLRIIGDIPLPTVVIWHLEREDQSAFRLELELTVHGGMTSDWLRQRLAAFGSLIAARIAPDLHHVLGSWASASQPVSDRLAARLHPLNAARGLSSHNAGQRYPAPPVFSVVKS